ncbi:hypothetical protein B296_00030730 [Ensete ventricosum]|uniref:Uncharacterized protein n=1 Tax=Ensete ventricosum TaxID=4639 RepID=A0A426ZEX8_ENSVE|nr:hypothetical protein B296_00030730 [Ensete ventricosum]
MVSMSLMHDNPKVGGGCSGIVSSFPATASTPALRVESRSPTEVQEIPAEEVIRRPSEEARGAPEVPSKRRAGDMAGQRKKSKDSGRHRLPHKADKSASRAARGKGPVGLAEETLTPRPKPRSMRELCSAHPGVDDRDYHAIWMSSLPERAPDAPLEIDLAPLTYEDGIWLDGEASAKYIRATQIPKLASDLYTLPSEVLMDGTTKAMVLSQHYQAALFDRVHDAGRGITSMDNRVDLLRKEVQRLKEGGDPDAVVAAEARASEAQSLADNLQTKLDEANRRRESMEAELREARGLLADLRRQLADSQGKLVESRGRLNDSESQLWNARTKVRQMETELLELTRSKDALRADLPRQAIEDYKKSSRFEMGLVRMGWVSLKYGYQLALAWLRARHLGVEIEEDPFALLPKDAGVPMAEEQLFGDSPPPPEE